ncbi:MAG: glycosyltransferase [Nitrospirales bacterium]|nr:glycosyltransferase [Nitrospira sp.]MDR4503043.1 glycosyltransferase [Nitrospirales bacterium]
MSAQSMSNRILVIAPTPFFADRGCHVRILGEIRALQKLGYEARLCTYHLGRDIHGIDTVRTMNIPWYHKLSAGPSIHKFYIDLFLLWDVWRVCRSFRPGILHAHLHEGIVIGKLVSLWYGIPMVADLQGSLTEEVLDHNFLPRWKWLVGVVQWIEKQVNRMPLHLITSASRTTQQVKQSYGISTVSTIGDGVDLELFSQQPKDVALQNELGIGSDDKVVVFIGVLTSYQGIDLLLDSALQVFKQIPTAKFLIMGFPEEAYRKKAIDMGLQDNVIFTGKIEYADAARYLSLGHVAVSPKVSSSEANLKLFTYMAMGLPCVVFDNPVNREILDDLGVYAENGDPQAFAQKIVSLLQDSKHAKTLGDACYQKASSEYSWDVVGQRLLGIYERYTPPDLTQQHLGGELNG